MKKGFDFDYHCGKKNEDFDNPHYDLKKFIAPSSRVSSATIFWRELNHSN